ncbi:MAG TPA: hypothetical protein VGD65_17385 [Chryseosolibacter sp.]
MKFLSFALAIALVVSGSCTDHDINDNACAVSDPATDLPWLAAEIAELEQSSLARYLYVKQSRHKSESVFIFANCCPFCSSVYTVFNCAGERIGSIGEQEFPLELLSNGRTIWKADDSACAL